MEDSTTEIDVLKVQLKELEKENDYEIYFAGVIGGYYVE